MTTFYDFTTDLVRNIIPHGDWAPTGKVVNRSDAVSGIILDTVNNLATIYKTEAGAIASGCLTLNVDGSDLGTTGLREIRFEFELSDPPLAGIGLKMIDPTGLHSELMTLHWYYTGIWRVLTRAGAETIVRQTGEAYKWWGEPGIYQLRMRFSDIGSGLTLVECFLVNPYNVPFEVWSFNINTASWALAGLQFVIGNLWTQDDAGYIGAGAAQDAAGEAILRSFGLYDQGDALPTVMSPSTTLETSAAKYAVLAAGMETAPITDDRRDLLSRITDAERANSIVDTFTVTLWDASHLIYLPGYPVGHSLAKYQETADRFDILQLTTPNAGPVAEPIPSSYFTDSGLLISKRWNLDLNFTNGEYIRTALENESSYEPAPTPFNAVCSLDVHHADTMERATILGMHRSYEMAHWYPGLVPRYHVDSEKYGYIPGTVVRCDATSGNFTLTYRGQTTANIAYNATNAQIRTALEALSNVSALDIFTQGILAPSATHNRGVHIWHSSDFSFELTATDVNLVGGSVTVQSNLTTQQLFSDAGLAEIHPQFALIGAGAYPIKWADTDAAWLSVSWAYSTNTLAVYHNMMATAMAELWPDSQLTTDPIRDHFRTEYWDAFNLFTQFKTIARSQHDPLDLAMDVEIGRVHQRGSGNVARIVVGPQLHGTTFTSVVPVSLLNTSCWVAVAFGADGITHFGLSIIIDSATQTWKAGGEDVWTALKTLKSNVYDLHGSLFVEWAPKTRRAALLMSFADYATGAGETLSLDNNAGLSGDDLAHNNHAINHLYQAMLYAGEPIDVVYDEEVLADRLTDINYDFLLVPSLHGANQGLIDKIKAFSTAGGRVICHDDCILETEGVADLQILDGNYWTDGGSPSSDLHPPTSKDEIDAGTGLDANEKRAFLLALAADLITKLPSGFTRRLVFSTPGQAIGNVMTDSNGTEYLILVNMDRSVGAASIALGDNYALDQANDVAVSFQFADGLSLVDIDTNQVFSPIGGVYTINLTAGWGRILRVVTAISRPASKAVEIPTA